MIDTLLNRGKANLKIAKMIYNATDDYLELTMAAFHIQQAVELALKHILEINGIDYPYSHDILELLDVIDDNNISLNDDQWIRMNSEKLTSWGSETNYVRGYLGDRCKMDTAITKVDSFLNSSEDLIPSVLL